MGFFIAEPVGSGPPLTDAMVARAEATLQRRLPPAYVAILRERNGGVPVRRCIRTTAPTSWAPDHIEISTLLGIGFEDGLDGELGSAYMVQEWGYPDIGLVICHTPSAGHDTVMLDYSECGPHGEPRVVYVDEDRSVLILAPDFSSFIHSLRESLGAKE
ncbi:SMI1/KNR4 family protein [Corallococcus sp. EGB]|uniref:SMI1/KNR4 family protein n=1 Tax=Corallococcus sp. EGB TaxID=1521117 RepID=UPI001CBD08B9|nr:SMI1/KNR4 family protein [Corallococcus sp. EGB]